MYHMEYERFNFLDVFLEHPDGSLSPKFQIEVNGTKFGPGVLFQKGVSFGGVDFHLYKYRPIALVRNEDGGYKLFGFYNE